MMWDEQIHDKGAEPSASAPGDNRHPAEPAGAAGMTGSAGAFSGDVTDFETAMAELEQTVRRLESGEAGLAEAMALFQKGTALSAACDRYLTRAETVINQLVEQPDGSFETAAFSPEAASGPGGADPGDES